MWLSLLFIQHLLNTYCVPGPALDAVETAVNKADKGSSPLKLMSSSLLKRRNPSRAGWGGVFLYLLFRLTLKRDSKRQSFSVYSDGPDWRQCRVWVFSSVIQGLTHIITEVSQHLRMSLLREAILHVGELGAGAALLRQDKKKG